ncbi:uncharacterized protein FIBRA_08354 [Fibroporia radiculosa]|uniref:Adenylate cyclase n=1 Tax=Fibroporia radiculosa TaxID=599839 RepID=J4GWM7_9APHY|nr:uncharacterized protein FIBRA_08354 [Fibroporia radiculosa]CCM06105.1 predicted protein [Fibroporia radiculosa]
MSTTTTHSRPAAVGLAPQYPYLAMSPAPHYTPSSSVISLGVSELSAVPQDVPVLHPQDLLPHAPPNDADNVVIAPWLASPDDEPPTPPPKPQRYGFPHKSSFASFSLPRQLSASNLSLATTRSSESHVLHSSSLGHDTHHSREPRRAKSSISSILTHPLSNFVKKQRSRSRLRSDVALSEEPVPPLPIFDHLSTYSAASTAPSLLKHRKHKIPSISSESPPPVGDAEFKLDVDLDRMEGIIDPHILSAPDSGSPRSGGFDNSSSEVSSTHHSLGASSSNIFSHPHPFGPPTVRVQRYHYDGRRISPTSRPADFPDDDTRSWAPPQSWEVDQEGGATTIAEESSSDENEPGPPRKPGRLRPESKIRPRPPIKSASSSALYKIRIYRANGTYHVVSISLAVTVDELMPELNKKLSLNPDREPHSLYLKERGRERVLAPTERPANIVRRRLDQAGYEEADSLEQLGAEDLTFLMRFVYKSNVLGLSNADDHNIDTFDMIDLTGRGVRTVPILLYPHADAIVSLNLSRNPMLEIPLDFIQACTTLRELRLSQMAMKKVPQSVRYRDTLHRLDLSCNRIGDLDDAGLDWIPELRSLKVQNNRMESLPWWFPRLGALKDLNISNNKFGALPSVVVEITGLVDLDISFNMIDKLPDDFGRLQSLERLIIVGNQVTEFPSSCSGLVNLRMLDCRRNNISDLSVVCRLPKVQQIFADHNSVHALDVSFGPCLKQLDASHNDFTQLLLLPGPVGQPYALTSLDISHSKLSALDELALAHLTALETLHLDHNSLRYIPESLGALTRLVHLSCSNNQLRALPASISRLYNLETLEVHNNSLAELPSTLWNCENLHLINATSNLLGSWSLPSGSDVGRRAGVNGTTQNGPVPVRSDSSSVRKASSANSIMCIEKKWPPIVNSLHRLYLGENQFTDHAVHPLALLAELRVLNLSFNELQEIPPSFFEKLTSLNELYLSGNKLSTIPTEDLHRLTKLEVLFLNGNKLQTLPKEIGKLTNLIVLDVGSNILKYNIFNWEFDWNWNFNTSLQYLNLSGNKRLEIRTDIAPVKHDEKRKILADFSSLTQLRVLGLMDVTATNGAIIPDENEDRRVRISLSEINGVGYGIADTLGATEHLTMLDLVQPKFRANNDEAIFAMFGRATHTGNNYWLNHYLQSNFLDVYSGELAHLRPEKGEGIPDALRRAFLQLNKHLHDFLYSNSSARKMSQVSTSTGNAVIRDMNKRCGASGIVLHLVGKTLYVANAGRSLAVMSRQGNAMLLSRLHDPFARPEITRIRNAEGWVSPKGYVNDEVDVARSFGFYSLLPVVNARPHICTWDITAQDEFVIVGNSGLWDNVPYQTAVDIARSNCGNAMIAAQKLRDLAISHGAEGSAMIMVIAVGDLYPANDAGSILSAKPTKRPEIINRDISRLGDEVPAPTGHVALVFTDIRNSTHLWEVNAGMPTAMILHNNLLRRQLRFCGGYEVKTEGDAFMCSFPNTMSALWWCLSVQVQLLYVDWPLEILECEDGKEVYDVEGNLVARGLSVRVGIHCGKPVCEPDPITGRMDYFGPMVNRSARIEGSAAGGQIMCSADVVREINARIFETEPPTPYSHLEPPQVVDAIRRIGLIVVQVGEVKLKGLEVPEMLSIVYPQALAGRRGLSLVQTTSNPPGRVQFSIEQMGELALLCIRLEMLSAGKTFRASSNAPNQGNEESDSAVFSHRELKALLPAMDKATDADLMLLLGSLTTRIDNALTKLAATRLRACRDKVPLADGLDGRYLNQLLEILCP